jgi:hypothetical protein
LVRIFLVFGLLALLDQTWRIASEIEARYTWPIADGEIVSSDIKDDKAMPGKMDKHTRYWVEYEVRFALVEDQCRTGLVYGGPPSSLPCVGTVRTRSTRSPYAAWQWLNHGYARNAPVKVLHNPSGPKIKIAGSSIWLFYPWPQTVTTFMWVIGFYGFHGFLQRRLEYLRSHPEAETTPPQGPEPDKYKLTSLDLS